MKRALIAVASVSILAVTVAHSTEDPRVGKEKPRMGSAGSGVRQAIPAVSPIHGANAQHGLREGGKNHRKQANSARHAGMECYRRQAMAGYTRDRGETPIATGRNHQPSRRRMVCRATASRRWREAANVRRPSVACPAL